MHLPVIVMSSCDEGEDSIDGVIGGQGAIVDDKVTFQALRNIVSTASGLDHCSLKLKSSRHGKLNLEQII
jgi:hypothetical protein